MAGAGTGSAATGATITLYRGYCTLAQLKAWLVPNLGSTDTTLDDNLTLAIDAASRAIERYTGRRFYTNESDETRYATASYATILLERDLGVDIISLTSLTADEDGDRTYERTWTTGDYDLDPPNATLDYSPYTRIASTPDGNYAFPVGISRGIKLVGRFGYCTTSGQDSWAGEVREACLIQASRLYTRAVTPMGVAGNSAFGEMRVLSRLDPDVELMLGRLVRDLAF